MKKIPRTFCVTLKETPIRTRGFLEESKKAGIHPEIFYGVFGQRMGLLPKCPNEIECPDKNIFMTDGAVGCYLSHIILWNIMSYLPEEEFLVVEDDAVFEDDFQNRFFDCYQRLPLDWDIVYVGWLPFGDKKNQSVVVDNGISIRHPSATHAYMIKKRVLATALDAVQPSGSPIDLLIVNRLLPKLKYYVFDPPLITQRSYLNTTEPEWNSLVYDWNNDFYGCREKLIKYLSLSDGWYGAERNEHEIWRWSKEEFVIHIPDSVETITLHCTTPIQNEVTFIVGETQTRVNLGLGDNRIRVNTHNQLKIIGKMVAPFIPQKQDNKSTDTRRLGICLKDIVLHIGTTNIDIPISVLCPFVPPAMTLRI